MTFNECVFWIGTAVVLYDALVSWAHVLLYTRSNWRMFEEGKALMGTMACFALTLTYGGIRTVQVGPRLLQDYPEAGILRIVIYVIVGFVVSRWFYLLLTNQHRTRNGRNHERR